MLNAEDTKERIRKLRLKVVSGPIDPMVEDNFKENIVEKDKRIAYLEKKVSRLSQKARN